MAPSERQKNRSASNRRRARSSGVMTKHFLGIAALLALSACGPAADDTNIAIDDEVNAAEAAEADIETLPPDEVVETGNLEVEEGNLSSRDPDNVAGMPLPPPPPENTSR